MPGKDRPRVSNEFWFYLFIIIIIRQFYSAGVVCFKKMKKKNLLITRAIDRVNFVFKKKKENEKENEFPLFSPSKSQQQRVPQNVNNAYDDTAAIRAVLFIYFISVHVYISFSSGF